METFSNAAGQSIVRDMIQTIQENKDYLSQIDGAIGDGDHGINMNKGFNLCLERLNDRDNFSSALEKLGAVLLGEIGGSMGPLYGSFFLCMANVSAGKAEIDATTFGAMLGQARDELAALGSAKVGDKTIMDTLIPAVGAYEQALAAGQGFRQALLSMEQAAEAGYASTKDLVAKIGRASRLGERSRGILDAGATSCYLLLRSMSRSIVKLFT